MPGLHRKLMWRSSGSPGNVFHRHITWCISTTVTSGPWGSWKRMFWRSAPGIRNCPKDNLTHLDQKRLTFLKTCTIDLGFLFAVQRRKDKGWEQTFIGLFLCASQFESFLSFTLWVINIFIISILLDLGKKCFWEFKSHNWSLFDKGWDRSLVLTSWKLLPPSLQDGLPCIPCINSFHCPLCPLHPAWFLSVSWISQISSSSSCSSFALFLSGMFSLWSWSVLSFFFFLVFSSTRVKCDLFRGASPDHPSYTVVIPRHVSPAHFLPTPNTDVWCVSTH